VDDFGPEAAATDARDVAGAESTSTEAEVASLERRTLALKGDISLAVRVADQIAPIRQRSEELARRASELHPEDLAGHLAQIQDEASVLYLRLRPPNAPAAPDPEMQDLRASLPAAQGKLYPSRPPDTAIQRVVVHHTATSAASTPEQIAQAYVRQGRPSIPFHFLVAADGTTFWTQPIDLATTHTRLSQVNDESIGVALVGNFTSVPPTHAQLAGAATLIAWLLNRFGLNEDRISGRRELEKVGSPGTQWDTGARYRDALIARVRAIRAATRTPEAIMADLRQEINELKLRIAAAALPGEKPSTAAAIEAFDAPAEMRAAAAVDRPKMVDVVKTLPRHPSLSPYPRRTQQPTTVVFHHTDTPKNFTVKQIALYHVYGERRDSDGTLVKGPWPGIGYHYVITADGTIYKCQDDMTRSYHVGGTHNDYAIGIALIGRFMQLDYSGKEQKPADRIPTAEQLKSAGQLAAWLMQQYKIGADRVIGHRDVWPRSTVCPGDQWTQGANWKNLLTAQIKIVQDPSTTRQIEHYLLFWDQGIQWAQADWHNAQPYIARFRPTCGFRVDDALLARRVTIVGGTAGVGGGAEARMRAAGITIHRLAGRNEAETKALLDSLVAKGTPWPGAPPRFLSALDEAIADREPDEPPRIPVPDEWTVPDDWEAE